MSSISFDRLSRVVTETPFALLARGVRGRERIVGSRQITKYTAAAMMIPTISP